MALTPPGEFGRWLEELAEFESPAFMAEVSAEMAQEVSGLISKGFETSTDPYGNLWAPRKLASGRQMPPHLPLQRSGAMRAGFHVEHDSMGLRVDNAVIYTGFHQGGTRFIDARPMLPNGHDLGSWGEPLSSAARRVFNMHIND